jgi:hypothetical protein
LLFPIPAITRDDARFRRSAKVFLMDKKIFWLLFTVLGAVMGLLLPLWWNLALTLPLVVLCWWVVYRSGWV